MQPIQNQLTENFIVTKNRNVFKTNILCELFLKVCKVVWEIFSIIIFPVKISRIIVGTLAQSLLLPAVDSYNLEKNRVKEKQLGQLEKKLEHNKWIIENCWGGVGSVDLSQGKGRKKLEKETDDLEEKIDKLQTEIESVNSQLEIRKLFVEEPSNHAHQVKVTTADGVEIDTMMIQNENQINLPIEKQKWIVFFVGNAMCYEELLENLKQISDQTGANVYTGNYRGVMSSKGSPSSTHDLILDGEAMVQKLLAAGVPSENILLHGWSIGGGVAAEVAAHHQEVGHEMHLCSDRSFSSIIDTAKKLFPTFGGVLGRIAWLAGWKFKSVDNFKKINGNKIVIVCKEDPLIRYEASLYKASKNQGLQIKNKIKLKPQHGHGLPLNYTGLLFDNYVNYVKEVLKL